MARPPLAPPDEIVSLHIMLKRPQIEKLGELCRRWGMQRPAVIRKLIDEAAAQQRRELAAEAVLR